MPSTKIKGYEIYYEVYGKGETIVLLNGIMMSTSSWNSFIDVFSRNNRLVLIDFLDQGKSQKSDKPYDQILQSDIVKGVIDELKIDKIHLVGVSYGGEVALNFALKYQENLSSLILANTTSYTTQLLRDVGKCWNYAAKNHDGRAFFKATMPFIYSVEFYEENIDWLKKREDLFVTIFDDAWYEAYIRLVDSAENLDIREEIEKIKVPTLIISAEYDITTPIRYQKVIHEKIQNSKWVLIKGSGHASMYEKPQEFASNILGFINTYDEEIKIV